MQWEWEWEEPFIKIAKTYHDRVVYMFIWVRNVIRISIFIQVFPKCYWKLEILLKVCKTERYFGNTEDRKIKVVVSLRGLNGMKHHCQLTNLTANSRILKSCKSIDSDDCCQIFLEFLMSSLLPADIIIYAPSIWQVFQFGQYICSYK